MALKSILLSLVMIAVIVISESEQKCDKLPENTRVKRAKYYSNPPPRFYSRPPITYPVKGVYSLTPPPFYMTYNEDSFPPGSRPPKVSKSSVPTTINDGLGDEDINNIVKYLSKQDLDKIIEFANEKDKYNKVIPFEYSKPHSKINKQNHKEINIEQQYKDVPIEYSNEPNNNFQMYKSVQDNIGPISSYSPSNNQKPYEIEYDNPPQDIVPRIVNNPNLNTIDSSNYDVQESMHNNQVASLNGHIHEDINGRPMFNDVKEVYTDSKVMREETLPRPVNLRDDDYYGSFTNNVPSVVKAESYKLENFGELPLMNYHSKLETVSSYHVPHYTVTTPKKSPPTSYNAPSSPPSSSRHSSSSSSGDDVPFEPAPPASAAKSQSDAHLKAVKIWTHKSEGTAYYLHSDGTLSLEKPQRPKGYGP